MARKILLVEDEQHMREIVADYFKKEGFEILEAETGRQAMECFEENRVDLVILDIMIPEIDGWSVCKRIRKVSDVPVIMLTARSDEDDKLMGFELGADEYVTKPFSPKVLVAQAQALLKRAGGTMGRSDGTLCIGGIEINKLSRSVSVDRKEIELAPREYELLLYLVENRGLVCTREAILNSVWGYDYFGDGRVVDTHIKKLRSKLGDKADHIRTMIRAGYKFEVNA